MRGGRGLGWSVGRSRYGLEVCGCGAGAGKISRTPAGLNFEGAGRERTKNFNPHRTLVSSEISDLCEI